MPFNSRRYSRLVAAENRALLTWQALGGTFAGPALLAFRKYKAAAELLSNYVARYPARASGDPVARV